MGLVLALVAAFYWRIKSIALPGGIGLGLSAEESAQVVEQVVKEADPAACPDDLAQATLVALRLAQADKLVEKRPLPPKTIEQVARTGLATAGMAPVGVTMEEGVTAGKVRKGTAARPPTETAPTSRKAGNRLRWLNVALGPSPAVHDATEPPKPAVVSLGTSAPLSVSRPKWNLILGAGRTIADLVFVNRYIGEEDAWASSDIANIDHALEAAMSDQKLQSVIAQYYTDPITSHMLPSAQVGIPLPATVYKDTVERLVSEVHGEGALAGQDLANCVINVMLPEGTLLSDDFSRGFQPPAGSEDAYRRRRRATIELDGGAPVGSRDGLSGYHGSIHLGGGMTIYYAVGVYSKGDNGIVAFDEPWKNVVATFYHQLNEVRTDPDVEDVNRTGDEAWLGWYSQQGQGEIGDLPIDSCGGDLSLVFKEVPLADGSGDVPIQLMWSNRADGPAVSA